MSNRIAADGRGRWPDGGVGAIEPGMLWEEREMCCAGAVVLAVVCGSPALQLWSREEVLLVHVTSTVPAVCWLYAGCMLAVWTTTMPNHPLVSARVSAQQQQHSTSIQHKKKCPSTYHTHLGTARSFFPLRRRISGEPTNSLRERGYFLPFFSHCTYGVQ